MRRFDFLKNNARYLPTSYTAKEVQRMLGLAEKLAARVGG